VVAMPSDYAFAPVPMTIEGWERMGLGAVIRSGFSYNRRVIFQIQPSLELSHYVYPFGEGLANFRVSGLLAARTCGSEGLTGVEILNMYFDTYAAAYNAQPLAIGVGVSQAGLTEGILAGMEVGIGTDPSGVALGNFSLDFVRIPRKATI
jgi:hypothetical protein